MSTNRIFIFPGQGAQSVGMGRDFYERFEWANEMWKKADEIMGYDLSNKVFNGPEEELKKTRITQPAVYVTEVIIQYFLIKEGVRPQAVAGHSLGEYAAVVASNAITWEQGLELVKFRGEIYDEVSRKNPGSMLAVIGIDQEKLSGILNEAGGIAEIVNYNSPGQLVVSIESALAESITDSIKQAGVKMVVPLEVGGGFHSSLLNDAVGPMREKIDSVDFKVNQVELFCNVTGRQVSGIDE